MLDIFTELADLITYSVFNLQTDTKIATAIHFFIEDTTKIFFLTVCIVFLMGLFNRSLNEKKIKEYLSNKPKWLGYLLAVILGWITPFCSCSSIPLFIGFMKAGVPLNIAITFFAVSPMPMESIAVLGTMIGLYPSLIYMTLCAIAGVIFGVLTEKLNWQRYVNTTFENINTDHSKHKEEHQHSCECETSTEIEKDSMKVRLRDAMNDVKNIIGEIWIWLIFGVVLGSLMHGYIAEEMFIFLSTKYKFLSIPFIVIMGVPLYANHSGIIPIMQVLFMKGVPLGSVLTFMMSITALSFPQLIILSKILRKELMIRFVGFLAISFMIIGLLFNLFYA